MAQHSKPGTTGRAKPGRRSKGPRIQHTIRVPADIDDRVQEQVDAGGWEYSDAVAYLLEEALKAGIELPVVQPQLPLTA
jgi:hypothetical protein